MYLKNITGTLCKISFVLILGCITLQSNAQQFRYGAFVAPGVNWWIVEGDLYISSGSNLSFQVGGMLDLTLGESERFALQSGLNFTSAPGAFEQNPESLSFQGKAWDYSIKTVDLPILLRLRSDELGKTVLFAQYGLTLGFTIADNIQFRDGKNGGDAFDYEGMNTSLTMGAGIEYALNDNMDLMINAFFMNGTKNMLIDDANDDNMFPQQLGIRAGILF